MTNSKAPGTKAMTQESKPETERKTAKTGGLDAEIVRDLEVDEQADDARGGGGVCVFTGGSICQFSIMPK